MKMENFEIEKNENLSQKKYEVEEVRETFWYFFFIESFLVKSIRPGNIFPFDFRRDLRLNSDSRKIKKDFGFFCYQIFLNYVVTYLWERDRE